MLGIEKVIGKRIKNKTLEYLAQCNQGYVWLPIRLMKYNLEFINDYEFGVLSGETEITKTVDDFEIRLAFENIPEQCKVKQEQQNEKKKESPAKKQLQKVDFSEIEVRKRIRYDQLM